MFLQPQANYLILLASWFLGYELYGPDKQDFPLERLLLNSVLDSVLDVELNLNGQSH